MLNYKFISYDPVMGFILEVVAGKRTYQFYYLRDEPNYIYVKEKFLNVGTSVKLSDLLEALEKYARNEDFKIGELRVFNNRSYTIYRRAHGIGILKWNKEVQIEPISSANALELKQLLEKTTMKIRECWKTKLRMENVSI